MDISTTTNIAALRLACRHVPPAFSLWFLDRMAHGALLDRLAGAELLTRAPPSCRVAGLASGGAAGGRAMTPRDRQRLDRGAARLHAMGPRVLAELLAELASHIGGAPSFLDRLAEYERLTPDALCVTGGDRFPHRPLHVVPR